MNGNLKSIIIYNNLKSELEDLLFIPYYIHRHSFFLNAKNKKCHDYMVFSVGNLRHTLSPIVLLKRRVS